MSNDKTLATAKHGGCVQLGDWLPPIREDEPLRGDEPAGEQHDARMFNRGWNACRDAALSAQPSPGGQDALVDTARRNIRQFISRASFSSSVDKQAALSCVDVLEEALAARQPVGDEERAETYRKGWEAGNAAQAVDLGGIPEGWRLSKKATCYQLSRGNDIIGNLVGPDAEENAAIIARVLDSQAVGK